jgi:serine/threonine-protein kinase
MAGKNDIQALLISKVRRLQKLKEQQALRGIDTPVHILIEIEDLEVEIDDLQAELAALLATSGETKVASANSPEPGDPNPALPSETATRLPQLKNGERFLNRFDIKGFIGRGGFSDSYIAWDQVKDTEVVVKRLPQNQPQDHLRRYVEREIKIARKLSALEMPGLIKTYEVIQADGEACLIQENLPGRSLHNRIKDKGIIDVPEAVNTVIKVGQTLEQAHKHRLVHCDVKPLNIIIRSPGYPTLIDLGMARFLDEQLDKQEIAVSIPYSPPELFTGQPIDGRVDVYSLGMTLLHMLTGLPMFANIDDTMPFVPEHIRIGRIPNQATIRQHIKAALWEIESQNLQAIIERALAGEPDSRYPDMASFGAALLAFAEENSFASKFSLKNTKQA